MNRDAPLPSPSRATHLLISPEINAPLLRPVTHFGERQHRTHPTKEICLSSHGLGLSSSSFLCCPEAQLGNIWCCRRCAEGVISSASSALKRKLRAAFINCWEKGGETLFPGGWFWGGFHKYNLTSKSLLCPSLQARR